MLTRCPSCATHFRVTPEQLKARGGRVRCGQCQHVFNALDSLIEEPIVIAAPMAAVAVPPTPTFEQTPEALEEQLSALQPEIRDPSLQQPPDATESEAVAAAATEPEAGLLSGPEPRDADADADADATAETPNRAEDWSTTFPEPPTLPRRWPWAAGTILCVLLLLGQFTYHFRADIAVLEYSPETYSHIHKRGVIGQAASEVANLFGAYVLKPCLLGFCGILECSLPFPTNINLLSIEASDLHPDSERKGLLVLAATLKNRAPFAQQFPHLELTLTDTADQAIARKVLVPADYLPPRTPIASGMKPNADIMVAIGIDSGQMAASGYRLYIFYP